MIMVPATAMMIRRCVAVISAVIARGVRRVYVPSANCCSCNSIPARVVMTPEIVAVASARDDRVRSARNKTMAARARSVNNVRGRGGRWMNRDGRALTVDVRLCDRQAWRNEREKPNEPRSAQHDGRKTKSAASHSSLPFHCRAGRRAVMHITRWKLGGSMTPIDADCDSRP
jgi:hypothetical protein